MKLYYTQGACSLVVRIILNELDLPFEAVTVDLKTKKLENGNDFRTINPKGSVPCLEINTGTVLTENAVILQYLADNTHSDLLPEIGDFSRYRVLERLNYITTEIHKGFGPLFNPNVPEETKKAVFIPLLKTKFQYMDELLKNSSYLYEKHFTLPDAYLYVMVRWAVSFKMDLTELTHLSAYINNLNQRKSIQKSLLQENLPNVSISEE